MKSEQLHLDAPRRGNRRRLAGLAFFLAMLVPLAYVMASLGRLDVGGVVGGALVAGGLGLVAFRFSQAR